MPYVNEELKSEYQQRTATPYMREWREKNREHHREYIKQWKRKQYADETKRKKILEDNKKYASYERCKNKSQKRWKEKYIKELDDLYIIGLLTRRSGLTRQVVRDNYEIVDLYRKVILTKRKLKENDNRGK